MQKLSLNNINKQCIFIPQEKVTEYNVYKLELFKLNIVIL